MPGGLSHGGPLARRAAAGSLAMGGRSRRRGRGSGDWRPDPPARRWAPEDIAWALRVDPAALVWVVHTVWAAGDEPAAYVTTYLPADTAGAIPGTDPPGADETGAPAAAGPAGEPVGIPSDGEAGE